MSNLDRAVAALGQHDWFYVGWSTSTETVYACACGWEGADRKRHQAEAVLAALRPSYTHLELVHDPAVSDE